MASDVSEDTEVAFRDGSGNLTICETNGRGTQEYAEDRYGELHEFERAVADSFENLHTILISLTGTPRNAVGGWRAPVDFIEDLLASKRAVYAALRRCLDGKRHFKVRLIAPHDSAYPHIHLGVYVDGQITADELQPVVDAHVRNSPVAKADHHPYEKAISVERHPHASRVEGYETGLATYLGDDVVGIEGDVDSQSDDTALLFATAMKASGTDTVTLPQQWREKLGVETGDDGGEWEYVGVVDDQGNVIETDDSEGGGMDWVRPRTLPKADPVDHGGGTDPPD